MPHNKGLIPKKHSYKLLFGQLPLTQFKDYRKSIKVELLKYDDPVKMLNGTYEFVKATWSDSPDDNKKASLIEKKQALKTMLEGKALGLGLETINFMFKVSGITRVDTHQIVRQRIGVTFSQQCTGDRMMHHNNILVEECINSKTNLGKYMECSLNNKICYANMIDNDISIQAARSILPHNLETFILMNTNLATLMFFYQKRIDDGSQTWQINEIARQMSIEVCKIFPDLESMFEKNKNKFKFQKIASMDRTNNYATNLYIPEIDDFEYHERDFLYNRTKKQMHFTNTPIKTMFYFGLTPISKNAYEDIKQKYEENNKKCENLHLSNEEIKESNEFLTTSLLKKYVNTY